MREVLPASTCLLRRRKLRGATSLMLATALMSGLPALAQSNDDENSVLLDTVVVTAAGFEQLLKDAPASVSVISGEELRKGNVTSLNDILKEVQGVAVTGLANESDIYIRGLPGAYTLILVDGKRQSTRDARTNGSSGFEQSFIPPVSAIERVEVVRGPMSSLYGSDAMGGVVNLITKRVSDVWSGEVTVEGTFNSDPDFGDNRQLSFYLNGPVVTDRLGLQIWGRTMRRDAASLAGGVDGSDEYDLGARLTWRPTDAQDVMLEFGRTELERQAFGATTYSENTRNRISLTHLGHWDFGTSEISLSREVGQRTGFTQAVVGGNYTAGARAPEITNTVLDAKLNMQLGANGQHNLTFGGQFFRADLVDQNPGQGTGLNEKFRADQWALFLEDEWRLNDSFALTMGLRYNAHDEYKAHVTPRLYGVWSVNENLTIKGGISTGFRAPDIRSITPGYAYTTGGGNCRVSRSCGVIIADPNLKPESSTSVEMSAMWEQDNLQFGATAFHTQFRDKIENFNTGNPWTAGPQYLDSTGTPQFYNIWYNRNVSKAAISGLELTTSAQLNDNLRLRANYTFTDSKQKSGAFLGFPLARTPRHMASLRFDWATPVAGLDTWFSANYHGSEIAAGARLGTNGSPVVINGVTGRKYGGYTTLDIGANYALTSNVNMNVAIYNLLDKRVGLADSNTTIEGRRAWLGITTRF